MLRDCHAENNKTLVKQIERDTNKWKDSLYSWIWGIYAIKWSLLPIVVYRFNTVPFKTNSQSNLKQKEQKLEVSYDLTSKTQLPPPEEHGAGIKKHTDQWNKVEGQEAIPHIFSQQIFDKGAKNVQWEKNSFQ
jgi:hypothetical protein